jgi:hypothetical protein
MRRVCPQCRMVAPGQMLCPTCGIPTVEIAVKTTLLSRMATAEPVPTDHAPSMPFRLVAAIIFSSGTFFGLQLIFGGGHGGRVSWLPGHMADPALIQPLAVYLTAWVAGIFVGAGNWRSWASGAIVGIAHMTNVTAWYLFVHGRSAIQQLIVAWVIVPAIAAVGGRIGRFLFPHWLDVSDQPMTPPIERAKTKRKAQREPIRIAWARVLGGAALAVGCTVWAGRIREYILGTSGGLFTVDSRIQVHFVTWVIASLAALVGGIFAGASTRAGLRHGLLVGVLSCIATFVIYSFVLREALPAERFFATVVGLSPDEANQPARVALFLLTNSLLQSVIGGWIGAMLLPPTARAQRLDRGAI